MTESAVKLLGFKSPKEAVGQSIFMWGKNRDLIGVVNDFHQKTFRFPIEPTVLIPYYSPNSPISVKVNTKDLPVTIAGIKKTFDSFFPGNLFDYFFLDEKFNKLYSNDQLFGKVFALFAGFAIFISCLGLFGLSLFATAQRTKEIGVRKVLGASNSNIVVLLSKDFVVLIVVAIIIATPIAWMIMHTWLQNFAYRIEISWWIFFVAGLLSIAIALLTVSFQAVKSAVANPVKSLRTE